MRRWARSKETEMIRGETHEGREESPARRRPHEEEEEEEEEEVGEEGD
jgi:hypothetical protein